MVDAQLRPAVGRASPSVCVVAPIKHRVNDHARVRVVPIENSRVPIGVE